MKREITVHFLACMVFFGVVILLKGWFDISYLPFFIGGILGTILPDFDHLLYIYLRPHELTSQRAIYGVQKGRIWDTFSLLAVTRSERRDLVFHKAWFQIIFLIFAFLIITSSGSLVGRGIVLAFLVHLLVDQFVDLMKMGSMDNWFAPLNLNFDREKQTLYFVVNLVILLILGIVI